MLSSSNPVRGAAGLLASLAILAAGCAVPTAPAPTTGLESREAAYLQSPLIGYPRSLSASEAETLRSAHRSLLAGENAAAVAEVALMLLEANPDLDPAQILWAQSDFISGHYAAAFDRAHPVAERFPDYLGAQLVAGRSAEKLDRIKSAFEAYRRIADRSGLANRRAEELFPRAIEIAVLRTEDLLEKGRVEEAGAELEQLESWASDEIRTLELVARYSAVAGAPERELTAVKRLIEFDPSDELLRRRARLEMEAGDAGEGLRILEELTRQNPEDYELALELDRAKFRWRLDLLPAEVRGLLELPELTRADFAKLLFWLFPDVRYGRSSQGRIASDILDHPHRQEIARVINLNLMTVDSTLHLFHPERSLRRQDGLESVLRILSRRRPRPACLGSADPSLRMSVERLCALAARCGFFPESGDCLPEATASGRFVETIGFAALDVLGAE
ncbi:MAG: hypothetical protein GY769_17955 [bacterium]|nr:hypothetical protein [bacterium]